MIGAIFFWLCACMAVAFGIGVVVARKPMHSAVSLVITFIAMAGLFLHMNAEFIAFILIIVYTGAIMVLIIFVISLLNLQLDEPIHVTPARRWGVALLCVFAAAFMAYLYRDPLVGFANPARPIAPAEWGAVKTVGLDLFTRYVLPFEIVAVLLTAAVIGAIILANTTGVKPVDSNGESPGQSARKPVSEQ